MSKPSQLPQTCDHDWRRRPGRQPSGTFWQCKICKKGDLVEIKTKEGEGDMTTTGVQDIQAMTNPQLVKVYNALRASQGKPPVKKFRDLNTARQRVTSAIQDTPNAESIVGTVSVETVPERLRPAKTVKPKKTATTVAPRSGAILDSDEIVVLDANCGKRTTQAIALFKKHVVEGGVKTAGEYRQKAGKRANGDLKWWIKYKRIKLVRA